MKISEYPAVSFVSGNQLFLIAGAAAKTNNSVLMSTLSGQILPSGITGTFVTTGDSRILDFKSGVTISGYVGLGAVNPIARLQIGTGNSTTSGEGILLGNDVSLYRSANDTLYTPDNLNVGASGTFSGYVGIGTGIPQSRLSVGVPGCTTSAEGIQFGQDVSLYRSAADTLNTADKFTCATIVGGNSYGTITAGGASTTSPYISRNFSDGGTVFYVFQDMATASGDLQQWRTDVGTLGTVAVINSGGYLGIGNTAPTYPLDVNGVTRTSGLYVNCTLVSGNYTGLSTDYIIEQQKIDSITTIPSAIGCKGKLLVIKNSTSGDIGVMATVPQLIDNVTGTTLSTYNSLSIYSNNTNWRII